MSVEIGTGSIGTSGAAWSTGSIMASSVGDAEGADGADGADEAAGGIVSSGRSPGTLAGGDVSGGFISMFTGSGAGAATANRP